MKDRVIIKAKCYKCGLIHCFVHEGRVTTLTLRKKCDPCKKKEASERSKLRNYRTDEYREKQKKFRAARVANGKKAAYERNRKAKDPLYKFSGAVRTTIYMAFRKSGYKKSAASESLLGCTMDEFKAYIQSQFEPGMTFDNYGEWHIDHKVPLKLAQSIEEIAALNHYTNLQPLWAIDNLQKGERI